MATDSESGKRVADTGKRRRTILEGCLIFLGGLFVVLLIAQASIYAVRRTMTPAARAASCPNGVFHLSRALALYAADHDGLFPPISSVRGNLMMDAEGFYPEYLDNSCWVQCEYSPIRQNKTDKNEDLGVFAFSDDSFCYLPWEIRTVQDARAFLKGYVELDFSQRDGPLAVELDGEVIVLQRTTTASSTPVLVEWPYHAHPKATVAFADGHRELVDVGETLVTEEWFLEGLRELASLDKPVPEWRVPFRVKREKD